MNSYKDNNTKALAVTQSLIVPKPTRARIISPFGFISQLRIIFFIQSILILKSITRKTAKEKFLETQSLSIARNPNPLTFSLDRIEWMFNSRSVPIVKATPQQHLLRGSSFETFPSNYKTESRKEFLLTSCT
uniref:Uncharacterized protein n=1 Tax=Glossina austeni TaxID=7395 RepID=A0A1A9VQ83_GLOAU